ncbi:hypothetical protein C8Q76DRAFT_802560 [Earliella scabrosa]|nr:hypothetical protein C8Q76DRAFT_802560 [Earliella scabrosa]
MSGAGARADGCEAGWSGVIVRPRDNDTKGSGTSMEVRFESGVSEDTGTPAIPEDAAFALEPEPDWTAGTFVRLLGNIFVRLVSMASSARVQGRTIPPRTTNTIWGQVRDELDQKRAGRRAQRARQALLQQQQGAVTAARTFCTFSLPGPTKDVLATQYGPAALAHIVDQRMYCLS